MAVTTNFNIGFTLKNSCTLNKNVKNILLSILTLLKAGLVKI
jgi:hypothetical protein